MAPTLMVPDTCCELYPPDVPGIRQPATTVRTATAVTPRKSRARLVVHRSRRALALAGTSLISLLGRNGTVTDSWEHALAPESTLLAAAVRQTSVTSGFSVMCELLSVGPFAVRVSP